MIRNTSIKTKLMSLVVFASLLLGVLSIGAWYSLSSLKDDVSRVTQLSVPKLSHLSNMRYFGSEVTRLFLRVTTKGLSEKEITRLKGKLEDHVKLYEEAEAKYLAMPFEDGEKALFETQDEKWDEALKLIREGVSLIGKNDEASEARISDLNGTVVPKAKVAHNETFQTLHDFQTKVSDQWRDGAEATARQGQTFLLTLSIVGITLMLIGGYFFASYLAKLLSMIASRLNREAIDVKAAAEAIATTSAQISSGATQQAASLEQTAASMNEITAMVSNSASSARKSKDAASDSQHSAESGKDVMRNVLKAIHEIDHSNQAIMNEIELSNKEVGEIVSVIETIRDRTQVINDIVFQTKLLSFNASVEAARAGEMGKGFAVVAEEVGKLAEMSGTASKEISSLLAASLDRVRVTIKRSQDSVGQLMQSGSVKIKSGVTIADRGHEVLGEIVQSVTMMESLIAEISGAAEEQSKGLIEINSAITQLDNVTQINSGAAEESAASADSLRQQAEELYRIIAELHQVITGDEQKAA